MLPLLLMSQEDVLDVLEEDGGWVTKREIKTALDDPLSTSALNHNLRRLINGNFIEFKVCKNMKRGYQYRVKKDTDPHNESDNN